jgi:hypothetical protein
LAIVLSAVEEVVPLMAEISPGELIDKVTILEIKSVRITDPAKCRNVAYELQVLTQLLISAVRQDATLTALKTALRTVNETIWQLEDDIRDHERRQDFGESFVKLARSVYRTNDRRAEIKREINTLLDSAVVEEKSYAAY